jgi:hypothetical protein
MEKGKEAISRVECALQWTNGWDQHELSLYLHSGQRPFLLENNSTIFSPLTTNHREQESLQGLGKGQKTTEVLQY